jgi:hypothetical protein
MACERLLMQHPASELRRITLPRTPVNKRGEGPGFSSPGPCIASYSLEVTNADSSWFVVAELITRTSLRVCGIGWTLLIVVVVLARGVTRRDRSFVPRCHHNRSSRHHQHHRRHQQNHYSLAHHFSLR